MKTYALLALICLALLTPTLFSQTNAPAGSTNAVTAAPSIPEEARKHFVMGATLFKDAKTSDDYSQVEGEFKQAAELAPQWPEARYNLALAEEAAGDYSGAMADLKLYQHFKLSDAEARSVQDKIYVLEAKQQKKALNDAAKIAEDAAEAHAAAQAQATADVAKKRQIAGPVTLICNTGNSREASQTTIDLNESDGLVTIHFGATHTGGFPDPMPGRSTGPLSANFNQTTITFSEQPDSRQFNYVINRMTGTIDVTEMNGGNPYHYQWTYQVAKAQF